MWEQVVLIKYPTGEAQAASAATEYYCTNYNAEVQALKLAVTIVNSDCLRVAFFTDAKSVIQALSSKRLSCIDHYRRLVTTDKWLSYGYQLTVVYK